MGKVPFRHGSQHIAAHERIADLCNRRKIPLCFGRKRIQIDTALQKVARLFCKVGERVLQTVIHSAEQSRPKFNRQEISGKLNFITDADTLGNFEYLHLSNGAAYTDDLALQFGVADMDVANFV